jgi:ATP-dependent Lhr-like helicase
VLSGFHELVQGWFGARFGEPSAPQRRGWPAILAGRDTLISSPTGSGKTLAAFLAGLDGLVRQALDGTLKNETQLLYISPLKALSNDVRKNLEEPLAELQARAVLEQRSMLPIRTAVRTGDTASSERASMLKKPPHVLVTTPESLYVLLTSEGGRKLLAPVRTVIVDEIHAVARDKRGAHLSLSLERLDALCKVSGVRPLRIGLSATQRPIEELARYLVGTPNIGADGTPRCEIVEEGRKRALDLKIELPPEELGAVATKEQRAAVHERVAQLVLEHKTTLVFVNTRRQSERVCHALSERLGEQAVAAHHGSLSRQMRFSAETRLKNGELKAVVATASLELGIDVGAVDLVVQLESPRSLSVMLQRIGRAGHFKGGIPKGRLFPMTRDQLIECAALARGLSRGALEETQVPSQPLDVLAQQIVAEAACRTLPEDELLALVRGAYPYRALTKEKFEQLLQMLNDGVQRRAKDAGARIHRDVVNHTVRGRRGARLAALTSGGAIPDTAQYAVVAEPEGVTIGSLDEDFAIESMAGDVFLLGNDSWRIRRVEQGKVRVENAHGAAPSVPFWNGEAPGRTAQLSIEVSSLRAELEPLLEDAVAAAAILVNDCALNASGAEQAVRYLAAAKRALGSLPTHTTLVAERFFDESGGMQLIVHAPFGARLNRAFGLALRKCFCRTFDFELQAAATDEGILLSLGPQHSFPLESVFDFLTPETVNEALTQAALLSPLWGARWRWNVTRSLMVLRFSGGKKVPFNILRMRVDDLLGAVFPAQAQCQEHATGPIVLPDHPLVNETIHDCLHEAMDLDGLRVLLEKIGKRELTLVARDTPEPSPLAHEILGGAPYSYLDDAPLEERRARAVSTRRTLSPDDAATLGALDASAIAEVSQQAWPEVRDANELHALLLSLGYLPDGARPVFAADSTAPYDFAPLVQAGRATRFAHGWTAAECLPQVKLIHPRAEFSPAMDAPLGARSFTEVEDAVRELIRGWIGCIGPTTVPELARRLCIGDSAVELAMVQLENEGVVLRGRFRSNEAIPACTEWCERTLLSRIHRRTLGRLRREIEPVTTSDFTRFLLRWQHVHPGTQQHGAQGLLEVIGQLQGFQLAASAWESDILPARVARYEPAMLDQLSLSGEVAWGRLCTEAAPEQPADPRDSQAPSEAASLIELRLTHAKTRSQPTRATPLTLLRRDDLPWMLEAMAGAGLPAPLGIANEAHELLQRRGALFLHEIRSALGADGARAEEALRELVYLGLVSCDSFGAVRQVVSPAKQQLFRTGSGLGRWSLLRQGPVAERVERKPFAELPQWTETLARQYLRRYGVVFRDLLVREPRCPAWRDLVRVFRRLEDRGELRGGRFVQAFYGEQFALPEALDALRTVRRIEATGEEKALISASDPLNLVGVLTGGPRVPATASGRVLYVDGASQPLELDERSLA